MEQIKYIGIDQLNDEERQIIETLSVDYHEKIARSLKDMTSIVIHVKEHKKVGERKKYGLHIRAVAPTKMFETENTEWELAKLLHESFKDIEKQIQHKLHTDEQANKPRMKAKTQRQQR